MENGCKVLIADDSSYHRSRLIKLLREHGFEVYSAEDGVEAVQLYKKVRPRIVITDINMPIMDGIEEIGFIKRIDPEARIIVFSSLDEQSMVMKAIKAGARDYLVKPLKPDIFLATVQKHCEF